MFLSSGYSTILTVLSDYVCIQEESQITNSLSSILMGTKCWCTLSQVKGLSREELAARSDLVLALPDRIQSIPDGSTTGIKQTGGWTASGSRTEIRFDSTGNCHFVIYVSILYNSMHFFHLLNVRDTSVAVTVGVSAYRTCGIVCIFYLCDFFIMLNGHHSNYWDFPISITSIVVCHHHPDYASISSLYFFHLWSSTFLIKF